ncbi:DUF4157 domain-containing protein [Desulfobacter curvatus]|uniref:eCIS core domain-containing protein n=1 Tax=Desulfobacter curvatus TaxID=2290 RepID=UPI000370B1C5|nr:DUF4157 domain-containing protein [Desulfobacter curvatus]
MCTFACKKKPSQHIKVTDSKKHDRAFSFQNHTVRSILHLQPTNPPVRDIVRRKKNQSLPKGLQENIENSFGQDFTTVNIQKNSQAAVDLNARAFAQGETVHFAPGEFSSNSKKGKNLIGHEFAHVVQQRSGVVKPTVMRTGLILNDDKELEREADIFGEKAVDGEIVPKYQSSSLWVRNDFSTIRATSNIVQFDEYDEPNHDRSVPHLMRLLDEGNANNIRAALEGLRRAESTITDTSEATRVVFTTGQDTYNLTITSNEVDEFIRLYERYLSHRQTGPVPSLSDQFVNLFNRHFSSIRHILRPRPGSISSPGRSPEEISAEATSANRELSAREIAANFTPGQINLLSQYLTSHIIPERLFNGDETNLLDAGQRIVISAHILANGVYNSGFRLQEVYPRMCFHWAHIVYHYAGVTPPSGPLTVGVMGTTDPTGQVVLGGGTTEDQDQGGVLPAPGRRRARERRLEEARVAMETARGPVDSATREAQGAQQERDRAHAAIPRLQAQQRQEIQEASQEQRRALRDRHRDALSAARQRLRVANRERNEANRRLQSATQRFNSARREHSSMEDIARQAISRRGEISPDDIRNLQRGDWLYIYTNVDTRTGDHSVIFSRWLNFVEVSPTRVYGQAELYSGSPQRPGRTHTEWIGSFSGSENSHNVHGITRFQRMSSGSNPADTTNEILPPLSSRTSSRAVIANRSFIEGRDLDRSAVMQRLAEQNRSLLDALAWRITPNQRALLLTINQEDNLERRVQLNERLRNLSSNVSTSETARAGAVEIARSRYEPRIARRRESARRLLGGMTGQFNRVDERLQSFASAIGGRPNGVVPNSSARQLPTTLDADTFAQEIGFTVAAEAVVALNRLLQRETVTPEQAEAESRQIDQLESLFSDLSENIPPPGARRHLRDLLRSTQQNRNDINPRILPDFRRWKNACQQAHGPLDLAIRQLMNNVLIPFARTMRQQGGTLPFVTTHIGGRGESYSSTGLLSNVPNISDIQNE